ncbi:hypothetical protein CE131_25115, partial [Vibrio parahaemolyticus]
MLLILQSIFVGTCFVKRYSVLNVVQFVLDDNVITSVIMMRLHEIKINNFRKLKECTISFRDSTFLNLPLGVMWHCQLLSLAAQF